MKEKKLQLFDRLMLLYLIFDVLILNWAIGDGLYKYINIFLIIMLMFRKKIIKTIKVRDIVVFMLFLSLIIINIITNGIQHMFLDNFYKYGISNIIVIIYIIYISYNNIIGLQSFILNELYLILNGYFILNIPIIIKQLNYTYFMMRNVGSNIMYEDHITGLIGSSGTHRLTFLWILIVIINIYKISVSKKKSLTILTVFYVFFMFFISSKNENTAFWILFPAIVMQFLFSISFINANDKTIKVLKYLISIFIVGLFIVIIYNSSNNIKSFIDVEVIENLRIVEKLEQYGIIKGNAQYQEVHEERIMLFKYALENGNGYKLGKGIGSILTYGDPSLPKHFGMSEISLRTYEGGLIYLLSLILVFTYAISKIFEIICCKKNNILFIVIAINITIMAIYTAIFRVMWYSLTLSIIMVCYASICRKNIIKENKREL